VRSGNPSGYAWYVIKTTKPPSQSPSRLTRGRSGHLDTERDENATSTLALNDVFHPIIRCCDSRACRRSFDLFIQPRHLIHVRCLTGTMERPYSLDSFQSYATQYRPRNSAIYYRLMILPCLEQVEHSDARIPYRYSPSSQFAS
jgi:hypothetical protein